LTRSVQEEVVLNKPLVPISVFLPETKSALATTLTRFAAITTQTAAWNGVQPTLVITPKLAPVEVASSKPLAKTNALTVVKKNVPVMTLIGSVAIMIQMVAMNGLLTTLVVSMKPVPTDNV